MKFLDLFSGIGGFRLGLEAEGHTCVGFCEVDKFARASYKAIHNTEGEVELHDITQVSDETIEAIGPIDIICGGFPCQAFSIAGKRRGFDDTRGTLFFEIARFSSILKPKYLFLENVKGLLSHDGGRTFRVILETLDELGYDAEWQVLNSKDFGVPQNRERVFIVCHLRGERGRVVFPVGPTSTEVDGADRKVIPLCNTNLSGRGMNGTVYSAEGLSPTLTTNKGEGNKIALKVQHPADGGREPKIIQRGRGYNKGGIHEVARTLSANSWHENNRLKIIDISNKTEKDIVGTLTAYGHTSNTKNGTFGVTDGIRIRKLTPKECWRLQGFPDAVFDKAQEVNSKTQLYKQAGNSVTVNVIEAIAKSLK